LGLLIGCGIIAHDLSDGLKIVTVILVRGHSRRRPLFWLALDLVAPIFGTATTLLVNLDGLLPWMLAFFAGSFLYIGASDLLPEAKEHDSPMVGVAMATGILTIFLTIRMLRE
jgi:zinc transporter ZupT